MDENHLEAEQIENFPDALGHVDVVVENENAQGGFFGLRHVTTPESTS